VEIGGTWTPVPSFLASVTWGIQNRVQHSAVADFDEDSYPLTVSAWYAPTCALSFSAGYAYLTNWIRQGITLGDDFNSAEPYSPVTRNWDYGGRSEVWSLGSTYAWTRCLQLRGNLQYVRGRNEIASTVFDTPHVWPEIAELARDAMDSTRLSAGFDYRLHPCAMGYVRYNYLQYDDRVRTSNDGAAHLLLAGLAGRY
jgi:predicted porin